MDDVLKSVADARRIVDEIVRRMRLPFRWTPIANDWQDCSPLMAQE